MIGRRELGGRGELRDADGRTLVVVPVRSWEDFLELGVTEIRQYGATSVQVPRRLRALLEELRAGVRPEHRGGRERPPGHRWSHRHPTGRVMPLPCSQLGSPQRGDV